MDVKKVNTFLFHISFASQHWNRSRLQLNSSPLKSLKVTLVCKLALPFLALSSDTCCAVSLWSSMYTISPLRLMKSRGSAYLAMVRSRSHFDLLLPLPALCCDPFSWQPQTNVYPSFNLFLSPLPSHRFQSI